MFSKESFEEDQPPLYQQLLTFSPNLREAAKTSPDIIAYIQRLSANGIDIDERNFHLYMYVEDLKPD